MNIVIRVVSVLLLLSLPAVAEQQGVQDKLLDQMSGTWVMRGTIGGNQVTHDLVAEWVLGHQYLRFHEVALNFPNTPVTPNRRSTNWPSFSTPVKIALSIQPLPTIENPTYGIGS